MSYYSWMITWVNNVNNFQIAQVQPQLSICLIFCLTLLITVLLKKKKACSWTKMHIELVFKQ